MGHQHVETEQQDQHGRPVLQVPVRYIAKDKYRREGKGRTAAGLGMYLNEALTIWQHGWFEEKFLGEHPLGRMVVCCGVNRMIIHFFKASIPPRCCSINPFLKIILVQNR